MDGSGSDVLGGRRGETRVDDSGVEDSAPNSGEATVVPSPIFRRSLHILAGVSDVLSDISLT